MESMVDIMYRKKISLWSVVLLATLLLLQGCTAKETADGDTHHETEQQNPTQEETEQQNLTQKETDQQASTQQIVVGYEFEDDLGREVTVEHPKRVAALLGSFADVWMLAGGDVVAAANDSWESLELPLGEDVVNLGSILEPDVEQLIAAKPDLVLASANTDADVELEEVLTQAGITVAYFALSNFDEYLHMLKVCTDITGRADLYEQNGLAVQKQIETVKERIDGRNPTILFLRASSKDVKAKGSKDNVGGEMLADLGCINIADSDSSLLDDLSMEAIIAADPEYIFVTTQGKDTDAAMKMVEELLTDNPAWASLSAVQNGNYHVLDKKLYHLKPNARWGEAYEKLADILYPVS